MIRSTSPYFFPVFFPAFFDVFFDFFSSFFCIAFTEATFFTIFCSSIRKARRMLGDYSLHSTILPVMDALVAQIATVGTGHRALRSGNSSHISRGDAGKLSLTPPYESPTPARGFLQQPHFIGLTIFLLY